MAIEDDLNNLAAEKVKDDVTDLYYHLVDRSSGNEKPKEEVPKEEVQVPPHVKNPEEEHVGPKTITLDELRRIDPSFSVSMFITKVNNMFVKFMTDIMMDRLPEIKHFVNDEVYAYGENILNNVKSKGQRQMYDELNVKDTKIVNSILGDGELIVKVLLQSRYMEYIISLDDGSYISGNNTSRKEVSYTITLSKKIIHKDQDIVRKCPGCGAPIDVNASGKCEYCGTIYNQEDYDWVITGLAKL